jgi:hypothetical protein
MIYIDNDGKQFSGAGVLIIEDYYNRYNVCIPTVLLVRNASSGNYGDFGGMYEKHHTDLQHTAIEELREESLNLFDIDSSFLDTYVDIPTTRDNIYYRTYIIKINNVSRKHYMYNYDLIEQCYYNKIRIPRCWRETDDITHVPISNLLNNIDLHTNNVIDVYHNYVKLTTRTKKIIKYSKEVLESHSNIKAIGNKDNFYINDTKDFLNGTYTFVLNKHK